MKSKARNKLNMFVRYGGINAVTQRGYSSDTGDFVNAGCYHKPPTSRGIYAFPLSGIETFLCGHRMGFIETEAENDCTRLPEPKYTKIGINYANTELSKAKAAGKSDAELNWYQTQLDNAIDKYYVDESVARSIAKERKKKGFKAKTKRSPSHFEYDGPIWHHLPLPKSLKKSVKKKSGSWILTSFKVYERALRIQLGPQMRGYSRDHLEVFIERI